VTKMIMAVVSHEEAQDVLDALIDAGRTATFMESRGGMLRQRQLALFIAVDKEDLEEVVSLIKEHCHRRAEVESGGEGGAGSASVTTTLGGAAVFVWDLDRFETY
jgi:uncharacterized protein YaaQ